MKKLQHLVQSIVLIALAFSVNVNAWENVEIGESYNFNATADTATDVADRNIKYYTLVLDTSINFEIGVSNFETMGCVSDAFELFGFSKTEEECKKLFTHIYIKHGDENGTILAESETDIRKKLLAGTYTLELVFDDDSWGDIRLSEFEEESMEPKEINIGENDMYQLSELTPSIHKEGSYAEYYTFILDEDKYLAFNSGSMTALDFALGYIEESEILSISIYLIKGDKNGKVIAYGKDSITTPVEAGTYTIELTTEAPSIHDGGDFVINLAPVPIVIINNILFDD